MTQNLWSIEISPALPIWLVLGLAAAGGCLVIFGLIVGQKGARIRLLAYGLFTLLLLDPVVRHDEREPVNDIVAVVVDRTASQDIGARAERTEQALKEVTEQLDQLGDIETRTVTLDSKARANLNDGADTSGGTNLYSTLATELADIPPDRLGGIIVISDGQIHDTPETSADFEGSAPVHSLLTGTKKDKDRKLTITRAPKFAIVGQTLDLAFRIDDFGVAKSRAASFSLVRVRLSLEGKPVHSQVLPTGEEHILELELKHRGESIIEIAVEPLEDELTEVNNSAVLPINGIRDRLRVLLVSGEPHAGERTWRDLLKADPSVDLVHFTILRPPEKQDGTPANELALIAFPTRQLFAEKLDEFDLIIFDRYRRRGVLPIAYLANVARYVDNGGALLAAAGPSFASPFSLFRTPLAEVLPARPSGDIAEGGFRPQVSLVGAKHPVTAELPGANSLDQEADWGRWFRLIGADQLSGEILMHGPANQPLLILDHYGEGRIAQLLSDQAWLWTRGYEGGGPQAELLRRLAHWLMKEPELEEEDLKVTVRGNEVRIERQTMKASVAPIMAISPSGQETHVELQQDQPGRWTGSFEPQEQGLYRLSDGILTALAAIGPMNPKEFADVRGTADHLEPLAETTGGGVFWLDQAGVPDLHSVRPGRRTNGKGWIGIRRNNQFIVTDIAQTKLVNVGLALLLLLGSLILVWRSEAK